jgi:cysteine desulfurase
VAAAIAPLVLPGPPAEVWMHHLEVHGVLTSVGAACHANKRTVSPALLALGLSKGEAQRVLRISLSRDTTEAEIDRLLRALETVHATLAAGTR